MHEGLKLLVFHLLQKAECEQLLQQIIQDDIKAVFCDEIDMDGGKELISKMTKIVDFLWVVPSTNDLSYESFNEWEGKFRFLNLSQNFRNSREIVKTTKSVAEKKRYDYKQGIVMPPENFPTGCTPLLVNSIKTAITEARKRTKGGILVIFPDRYYGDDLNQLNEKWKAYHVQQNDFKEEENPYKFLQDGNILIIDDFSSLGFDWSTIIVIEANGINATFHACNYMMRCTTNLIIVKESSNE